MSKLKFKKITYTEYGEYMDNLTSKTDDFLKNYYPYKITKILALSRGGLPLGTHLSNHLNIDLILTPEDYNKENPKQVLVVDDLCDSGETFDYYYYSLLCCLFIKPRRKLNPTIYLEELTNNTWVIFPWEQFEEPNINKKYINI